MKKAVLWIFTLTLSWNAFAAPRAVTLEDAQRFAVQHNFGLQALKSDIDANRAEQTIARSFFLPRFGAVGGFENREGGARRDYATLGYLYGSWNLFNGFADQMEIKKSSILVQLAESNFRLAEIQLKTEIMRLFYRYLYQKSISSSYEAARELNAGHLSSARKRRASGLISEADLMDFELRDSSIISELRLIKQQMDETKLGLVRLMGPEMGTSFEPVGILPHMHLIGDVDEYLSQVSTEVESLKQSVYQTESAVFDLRKSRSAWFPSVDAAIRVGALPVDERLDNSTRGMTGMVTARWEFFSGLNTSGQIRRAEAQLNRRELETRQLLLGAMAAVEVGVRKLQSIEERVDLEMQNEERAYKLYKATLSEYNRGVKNSTDLKAVEQILLDARLRRVGFKNEFLEAKSELERTYNIKLRVQEHKDKH